MPSVQLSTKHQRRRPLTTQTSHLSRSRRPIPSPWTILSHTCQTRLFHLRLTEAMMAKAILLFQMRLTQTQQPCWRLNPYSLRPPMVTVKAHRSTRMKLAGCMFVQSSPALKLLP